jgi:hypothetical protein
MSGATSNISITISATDLANAKIAALNKTIANLKTQATGAGKPLNALNNTSGFGQAAQGMKMFGDHTLGAARALERIVPAMGLITAAGSLAGVIAFTKNWADAGNTLRNTAYPLSMTGQKLSELQIAAKIAGASQEDLTTGLQGLSQALSDAHWSRNAGLAGTLTTLKIGFHGVNGLARTAEDAIGDVATAMYKMRADPGAVARFAATLGIPPSLIPFMFNLGESMERAKRSHGAMTNQMIERAAQLRSSWEELSATSWGVANRIMYAWTPTFMGWIDGTSKWIRENEKLADTLAVTVVGALSVLAGSSALAAVLRAFGVIASAGAILRGLGMLSLTGPAGGEDPEFSERKNQEFLRNRDRQNGPPRAGLAGTPFGALVARGEGDYNTVNLGEAGGNRAATLDLENKTVLEVLQDQRAKKYNAAGRYQIIPDTLVEAARRLGLDGSEKFDRKMQDRIFSDFLAGSKRPELRDYLNRSSDDEMAAARAASREWASIEDPDNPGHSFYANNRSSITTRETIDALRRSRLETFGPNMPGGDPELNRVYPNRGTPQFGPLNDVPGAPTVADPSQGHVKVDVHFQNAPPGMAAAATASGAVNVAPLRIETPMPFAR